MTHAIRTGTTDQIAYFRAYDTDGSAKTDLTSATTGLTLSVFRINASAVSISSLSDKAADNTAHADGAIRQIQGNLYTVDLPDAAVATQVPGICVKGTYTGGVIEGVPHPIVGYDGTAVRIGASDGTGVTLDSAERVKLDASQPDYAPLTSLPAITAGWLTAAGIAAGALDGKGDWATADALTTAVSTISSLISALNNLSAKANWFGNLLLEVPDSGTRAYLFELVVRDDEDKLTNLDASPTIALVNAAGTDRSALITTGIANPATGRYTLTITIATDTVNESLKLTATGAISGETRYAVITPQVVDYDTATMINSIYNRLGAPAGASIAADIATRLASASYTAPDNAGIAAVKANTDNLPADPADQSAVEAAITSAVSTIQSTQASNAETGAAAALNAYDPPTNIEMVARTLPSGEYGTLANQSTILTNLSTIAGYLDTEIAAIKAKTDNLPADPTSTAAINTQLTTLKDRAGYLLSILAGQISNAGTSAEQYAITIDGNTFTVTYNSLQSDGDRGTTGFAKT